MLRGVAAALGYKTVDDRALIYGVPVVAGSIGTFSCAVVISYIGPQFGALMFPVVAFVAQRICVRAGILTAVVCMVGYNFVCAPPAFEFSVPTVREIIFYLCLLATALVVAPPASKNDNDRRVYDNSANLPFTSTKPRGERDDTTHKNRTFWDVRPTGDWAYDCRTGEEYARIYMERLAAKEPRPVLAWIIGDMVARGRFGATEIGFVQGLAKAQIPRTKQEIALSSKNDPYNPGRQHRIL